MHLRCVHFQLISFFKQKSRDFGQKMKGKNCTGKRGVGLSLIWYSFNVKMEGEICKTN